MSWMPNTKKAEDIVHIQNPHKWLISSNIKIFYFKVIKSFQNFIFSANQSYSRKSKHDTTMKI